MQLKEKCHHWLWCVCWLVWLCLPALAQYRFDHWTADNGLPQNSVRDIVQTRDGYLWLTTFDGLVRFDGVRFTVFNTSNSPGIVTNRFVGLYEDAQGDLWASMEDGNVTRLHDGRFSTFTKEHGLPAGRSHWLGGDGRGNLLALSGSHLLRWTEGGFQPADDLRLSLSDAVANAGADGAKHLPFWTDQVQRSRVFLTGQPFTLNWDPRLPISQGPMQDRQGRVWFSSSAGLLRLENGRLIRSDVLEKRLSGCPAKVVYGRLPLQVLSQCDDGSLWLTEVETQQSHLVARRPTERPWLVARGGGEIFVAYGDQEDNLWLGSVYSGLYRVRKQSLTAYAKPQGLSINEIYPVLEDRDGAIWIGGENKVFRFQDGVFTQIFCPGNFGNTSFYQDRAGRVWADGRWRLDGNRFVADLSKPDSFGAWTMYEDKDGAFWFGMQTGVVRYQNEAATHYTTKDGLAGDDTKVIIPDERGGAAGGLWLGSYGGLTHYKDGQFKNWTEKDGLPGNTVRALRQDPDGTLWIGTYDSGLGRFKDGKFTRYSTSDGLFDNGVFQILEDDFGWVWMSCNRGIYRVRKQELNDFAEGKTNTITSIGYGKGDGMLNVESNGGRWPAGTKARDGKLWFPTMSGVVVVDPATITVNSHLPPVVIEAMKIDRKAMPLETWQTAIRNSNSTIEIGPDQENFEIEYTALSFINAENLRFKYKLEGLDRDWVDAGTRRTAYFSHVAPGSYTFKVIAANSDGVWNEVGRSLHIVVVPPFYRRGWFLLSLALALAGLATVAYQYRIRQMRRAQLAQQQFSQELIESQEAERKRIAAELHDSLGQNLIVIKNWATLGLTLTPADAPVREQLDVISTAAVQSLHDVRAIIHNLRPHQLETIGLGNTLRFMIEQVGAASGIAFTSEIASLDHHFTPEAEVILYRLVQECVSNIVKHSQAQAATLAMKVADDQLHITVSDNGRGFAIADLGLRIADWSRTAQTTDDGRQTTDNNPQSASSIGRNPQSGFGLKGLEERVRILRGTHKITSAPGKGTTHQFTIPVSSPDAQRKDSSHEV